MEKKKNVKKWLIVISAGMLIGFVNGFFGGGGGMISVPLLEKVLKIDNKKSHATAMAVIFPLSIVSAIVYGLSTRIDWINLLYVTIGVTLGGVLGAVLLNKLNNKVIRIIFIIIMLSAGVRMLF